MRCIAILSSDALANEPVMMSLDRRLERVDLKIFSRDQAPELQNLLGIGNEAEPQVFDLCRHVFPVVLTRTDAD